MVTDPQTVRLLVLVRTRVRIRRRLTRSSDEYGRALSRMAGVQVAPGRRIQAVLLNIWIMSLSQGCSRLYQ